mgnify:CR=1 FL=1
MPVPVKTWNQRVTEALLIARTASSWLVAVDEIVRRGLAEDIAEAESLIHAGETWHE